MTLANDVEENRHHVHQKDSAAREHQGAADELRRNAAGLRHRREAVAALINEVHNQHDGAEEEHDTEDGEPQHTSLGPGARHTVMTRRKHVLADAREESCFSHGRRLQTTQGGRRLVSSARASVPGLYRFLFFFVSLHCCSLLSLFFSFGFRLSGSLAAKKKNLPEVSF